MRRAGMQCCTQQKERKLNATAEGGRNKTNQRGAHAFGVRRRGWAQGSSKNLLLRRILYKQSRGE